MTIVDAALEAALHNCYAFDRELGRGGMATVYLARDLRHERPVALKLLRPEVGAMLGTERFLREIRLTANLQHPHILPLLDSGEAAGQCYYVMPYVEGESLRARLAREGRLPLAEALRLTREIANALDYAHRQGVVHRDVKPENVLLSERHALVADFGIAKPLAADSTTVLTETGVVVGTAAYMSPEQATSREVGPAADVYSLGCMLYEMLAGEPPLLAATAQATLARRFTERAPRVRDRRPEVPAGVDAALARALAPTADRRFQSAGEFAEALQAQPTERRLVRWGLVAAVVGLVIGAALMATRHRASSSSIEATSGRRTMLVVLPPQNLGDSADAAFADGLGDEITTRLASLNGLAVIGRASAQRYRGSAVVPREIARELGVEYVLLTTVRWDRTHAQARVRVNSQLVRAADQTNAWTDSYDADLSSVFEAQGTVAAKIAEAMGVRLGSADRERLAGPATRNPEALRYYLRGRDAMRRVYIGYAYDLEQDAIRSFTEATRLDSSFAAAYAGLADALLGLDYATEARVRRADSVIHIALRLDPAFPEGRAALSRVLLAREQPDSAIGELERAREARPSSPEILRLLGVALRERAGLDSSLRVLAEAVHLDPRSAEALTEACISAYAVSLDSAAAYCPRIVALEPDLMRSYLAIAWGAHLEADQARVDSIIGGFARRVGVHSAVLQFGIVPMWLSFPSAYDTTLVNLPIGDVARVGLFLTRSAAARRLHRTAMARADLDSVVVRTETALQRRDTLARIGADWIEANLGLVRGMQGRQQEALAIARRVLARRPAPANWYARTQIHLLAAMTFAIAGDTDAALDELEAQLREPWLVTRTLLRRDPFWDPLRETPRFQRLVADSLP